MTLHRRRKTRFFRCRGHSYRQVCGVPIEKLLSFWKQIVALVLQQPFWKIKGKKTDREDALSFFKIPTLNAEKVFIRQLNLFVFPSIKCTYYYLYMGKRWWKKYLLFSREIFLQPLNHLISRSQLFLQLCYVLWQSFLSFPPASNDDYVNI